MHLFRELEERAEKDSPIRVAVIGTGFFGSGLIRQLARTKGFLPAVAANRTLEKAINALESAGVDSEAIRICDDLDEAQKSLDSGLYIATTSKNIPIHLEGIEVVSDTTGDVLAGAEIAIGAIKNKKHVVAANPETQATVGPILKDMADKADVIYSDVDGDQAGILMSLYNYYKGIGFTPVAAVNCKGILKRYATPTTQEAFAKVHGLKPWIASAAADGTKLNIEMAIVANATGMLPARTGMTGVHTTLENALNDFQEQGLLSNRPVVEYTLGIPNGVFIIGYNEDPAVRSEFQYLKMGDGPYYVFYYPYVLCHYVSPISLATAVLYHEATITPAGAPVTEVVTFAKHDLISGQRLEGIGGHDCYGLIIDAAQASSDRLLPVGLADYVRLTRNISKDDPICYDDVTFEEENLLISLRKQQDELFVYRTSESSISS